MLKFKLKYQFMEIILMTFVIKVMTANSLLFTFSIGHEEQIIGSYSFSKKKSVCPNYLSHLFFYLWFTLCYMLWCKKDSIICTCCIKFLPYKISWALDKNESLNHFLSLNFVQTIHFLIDLQKSADYKSAFLKVIITFW